MVNCCLVQLCASSEKEKKLVGLAAKMVSEWAFWVRYLGGKDGVVGSGDGDSPGALFCVEPTPHSSCRNPSQPIIPLYNSIVPTIPERIPCHCQKFVCGDVSFLDWWWLVCWTRFYSCHCWCSSRYPTSDPWRGRVLWIILVAVFVLIRWGPRGSRGTDRRQLLLLPMIVVVGLVVVMHHIFFVLLPAPSPHSTVSDIVASSTGNTWHMTAISPWFHIPLPTACAVSW